MSFKRGLFSHDSHVMRAVMSSSSWYRFQSNDYLKVGEHGKDWCVASENNSEETGHYLKKADD